MLYVRKDILSKQIKSKFIKNKAFEASFVEINLTKKECQQNKNTLKSVIPANNTCKIIYTGAKLASKFNIKGKISKEHKHDLICKAQCPDLN